MAKGGGGAGRGGGVAIPAGASERQASYIRDLYAKNLRLDNDPENERRMIRLLNGAYQHTASYRNTRAEQGEDAALKDAQGWARKMLPRLKRDSAKRMRSEVAKLTPSRAIDYLKNGGASYQDIIRSWRR